jgi:hypothetical protein
MKTTLLLVFSALLFQNEIPLKPTDDFELKLDLQFKQRPKEDSHKIELEKRTLPTSGMNAPYLFLNLKVLKPNPEEVRVKVVKNSHDVLLSRKFDPTIVIKMDLGFTDDIKDRVSAHHYIVTFMTKDKMPISKVEILFEEDGTYLVNGEKRGKI